MSNVNVSDMDASDEHEDRDDHTPVSITLYLDDAAEPFATYRPPANVTLDTSTLEDGPHALHFKALDRLGNAGRRTIKFIVANGPGISITGLRDGKLVSGAIDFNVNAFGSQEPFDALRAESQNPIPVWVWVLIVTIGAWAAWYGLEEFPTPAAFAATPTYAANPATAAASAAALSATTEAQAPPVSSGKSLAGFDYGALGATSYAANCQACHGAAGAGIPGAFPALVHDSVVVASDPKEHIVTVLKGLHGKRIGGVEYSSQMPAFPQLTDSDIAAAIDHERTSWGNNAPTITPDDVKRLR